MHQPAGDVDFADDAVECETVGEHVTEIKRDAARQGLQAENAEQTPDAAGFETLETSVLRVEFEPTGKRRIVDFGRRALPVELPDEFCLSVPQRAGIAQLCHKLTGVGGGKGEIEFAVPLAGQPETAAGEPRAGMLNGEAVEPPAAVHIGGFHIKLPQFARANGELLRVHIQPRQAARRREAVRCVRPVCAICAIRPGCGAVARQGQPTKPRRQQAVATPLPTDFALYVGALDLCAPTVALGVCA